jgi:hypothetical protein
MNGLLKAIAPIFIPVVILAAGSALYAAASQSGAGSMMPGGMMERGYEMMDQITQMMDHCSAMMGSQERPNEQWR